jgi:hypothetical protein
MNQILTKGKEGNRQQHSLITIVSDFNTTLSTADNIQKEAH